MHNRFLKTSGLQQLIHKACPDYDCHRQLCLASTGHLIPGRKQLLSYCASDDYDNCPIYLCKALRSAAAHGLDRENTFDSGK